MNNIQRYSEINKLLIEYYNYAKNNSNYINREYIRKSITRYGISDSEKDIDLKKFFPKWIREFENKKNIGAFTLPLWSYFCQFASKSKRLYSEIKQKDNPIKLYISLDSLHIEKGVTMIFDFMNKNNIITMSKVGLNIKSDSIVIRVSKVKDAKRIIDFVKHNKYLQEGINRRTNPFILNEEGILYTMDGSLSYSTIVASVVSMFINSWVEHRNREPNINDLYRYTYNVEKKLLRRGLNADRAVVAVDSLMGEDDYSKDDVYSLKVALNLFLKTFNKNFKINNFYDFFAEVENKEKYYYDNNVDVETILLEELRILKNKLGERQAILNIEAYSKTGDSIYISRDNNLRKRFEDINFRSYLNKYLMEKDISCRKLCSILLNTNDKVNKQNELYDMFGPYLQNNNSGNNFNVNRK